MTTLPKFKKLRTGELAQYEPEYAGDLARPLDDNRTVENDGVMQGHAVKPTDIGFDARKRAARPVVGPTHEIVLTPQGKRFTEAVIVAPPQLGKLPFMARNPRLIRRPPSTKPMSQCIDNFGYGAFDPKAKYDLTGDAEHPGGEDEPVCVINRNYVSTE